MFYAGRAVAKRVVRAPPQALCGLVTRDIPGRTALVPGSAGCSSPQAQISVLRLARAFSSTPAVMSDTAGAQKPHVVAKTDADAEAVRSGLEHLLAGRWSLTANGNAIERAFKFKNFTKTWDFMTSVALQCKLKNHHPEWSNVYTTTYIRWTTHHNGPGLTHKDVELAGLCDELSRAFGELEEETAKPEIQPEPTSGDKAASTLQGLADSAVDVGACDCSGPALAKKA